MEWRLGCPRQETRTRSLLSGTRDSRRLHRLSFHCTKHKGRVHQRKTSVLTSYSSQSLWCIYYLRWFCTTYVYHIFTLCSNWHFSSWSSLSVAPPNLLEMAGGSSGRHGLGRLRSHHSIGAASPECKRTDASRWSRVWQILWNGWICWGRRLRNNLVLLGLTTSTSSQ